MPSNRTKTKRTAALQGDLKPDQLEHLLKGYVLLDPRRPVFKSESERRRAWVKNRDFIFSLQGKKCQDETFGLNSSIDFYFLPFTRPEAWWRYDSPEPRRMLAGDPAGIIPEDGLIKGVPRSYRSREAWEGMTFESERDFLTRHNLLTPLEQQEIHAKKA